MQSTLINLFLRKLFKNTTFLFNLLLTANLLVLAKGESTKCNLISNCIVTRIPQAVYLSSGIACYKTPYCDTKDRKSSCIDYSLISQYRLSLSDVQLKREDGHDWIQLTILSFTNTCIQQDDSVYFLIKISFSKEDDCYNFYVPLSSLSSSKNKFVLPCIKLPPSFQSYPTLWVSVYYKEEIILLEVIEYSSDFTSFVHHNKSHPKFALRDRIPVKNYSQNILMSEPIFTGDTLAFTLQKEVNMGCSYSYNIFVFESFEENICDIHQTPLHQWKSTFNSSSLILNCSKNCVQKFIECKKYCIYGYFKTAEGCENEYVKRLITWTFFRVLPKSLKNFVNNIPDHRCQNWDPGTHIGIASFESLSVTFHPDPYPGCFTHYELILYKLNSNVCHQGKDFSPLVVFQSGKEIRRVFSGVKRGNYCIMIVPCNGNRCCEHWTKNTDVISLNGRISEMELPMDQAISMEVIAAVIVLLLVSVLAVWGCFKKRLKYKVKVHHEVHNKSPLPTDVNIDQESSADGAESLPLLPSLPLPDIVVYIFHTFEHCTTERVELLRHFLTTQALLTVITMEDMLVKIRINSFQWINEVLNSNHDSNKRYCFVMSEKSVISFFENQEAVRDFEDKAFHYALNCVSVGWCMSDYSHLFVVCFDESLCIEDKWKNIVPDSRYVIPENLIALCVSLGVTNNQTKKKLIECLESHPIKNVTSIT